VSRDEEAMMSTAVRILTFSFAVALVLLTTGVPAGAANLVAWYPFTGDATDHSGNGNDGTVYGAYLTKDCDDVPDQAYAFDGVSSHIHVSDSPSLRPNTLTVCFWACVDTPLTAGPSLAENFIYKRLGGEDNSFSIHLGTNPHDDNYQRPTWQLNGGLEGTEIRVVAPDTISLKTWHHIAGTFDGSTATLYIDGQRVESAPYSQPIYYDGGEVEIGAIYDGGLQAVDGKIDEVRIYSGDLSPAEIYGLAQECHQWPSATQPATWGSVRHLFR
jgi:hypothetical protein